MTRRPPRSTRVRSSAASDVYKRQDLGDPGHADEVVGAGEEHREGDGKGHIAAHGEPDGGGHELLLGDEHLEVALRADCGEVLGVGGVADLAVHDHDCLLYTSP